MFLYNKFFIKFFKFSGDYANFFRAYPYRGGDKNSDFVEFLDETKVKKSFVTKFWNFNSCRSLFKIILLYYLIHFSTSVYNFSLSSFRFFIVEAVILLGTALMVVLQYSWKDKGCLITNTLNKSIEFFAEVQDKYSTGIKKLPKWQIEAFCVMFVYTCVAVFCPLVVWIMFLRTPNAPFFFTSFFYSNLTESSYFVKAVYGIPMVYFIYIMWAGIYTYGMMLILPIYAATFLLTELRPHRHKTSIFSKESMREPITVLKTYRGLQILIKDLTEIVKSYLLSHVNNSCIVLTVGCNFLLIRFHDEVNIETLGLVIMVTTISTGFLIVTFHKLGNVHQKSLELMGAWNKAAERIPDFKQKQYVKKYIKGCQMIKVEIGSGFYQRKATVLMIKKIIKYTVNFLIAMNRVI